jgi:hypothetical protein
MTRDQGAAVIFAFLGIPFLSAILGGFGFWLAILICLGTLGPLTKNKNRKATLYVTDKSKHGS